MKLPISRSVLQWMVATVLVAASHAGFAPRSADAACGDYVRVHGQTQVVSGHATPREMDAQPVHPGEKLPCHGPSCSNRDREPMSPQPTISETTVKQWGVAGATSILPSVEAGRGSFWNDQPVLQLPVSELFRPPR